LTEVLHDLLLQLSPPLSLTSPLASIKPANPGSPGKMAVKTEREMVDAEEQADDLWFLFNRSAFI